MNFFTYILGLVGLTNLAAEATLQTSCLAPTLLAARTGLLILRTPGAYLVRRD